MKKYLLIISLLIAVSFTLQALDLKNPADYLNAFMKTRASLDGKEVVYWWTGTVYSFVNGEKDRPLFQFEGFNIARAVKVEGGYELLTREAAFYKDLKTGEILETWENPYTKQKLDVVHIWNDPVNQDISFAKEYLPYLSKFLPSTDLGNELCFSMDLFLDYPSPLPKDKFPKYSQSNQYEAAELFQFFVKKNDVLNDVMNSVPCFITWTRISPWMPFMAMGDKQGNLVFQCRGKKLANGFQDLPEQIKNYVMKKAPQFSQTPKEFTEPNETSWTYFKKLFEQGLIK